MKIGIFTFHNAFNYGAMLQAFATQFALKKMGHQPFFVDLYSLDAENANMNRVLPRDVKGLMRYAYCKINRKAARRLKRFAEFRNTLPLSSRYFSKIEIEASPPAFDLALVGSDQVWNCEGGYDPYWFLEWLPDEINRCSFASSFGAENINDEFKGKIKRSLGKFNSIAVREQDGVNILQEILGHSVTRVLDPTFLLSKEEWLDERSEYPMPESLRNGYILCHGFGKSPETLEFIQKLKEQYSLPVVILAVGISSPLDGDVVIIDAGPREYVDIYSRATVIYTNSFHGVAFAVHFRKPFFVVPHKTRNSRISNLLSLLGLENRMVNSSVCCQVDLPIDYKKADFVIQEEICKSMRYLEKVIEQCKKNEAI